MVFISTQKRQGRFLITRHPHYKSPGHKAVSDEAATLLPWDCFGLHYNLLLEMEFEMGFGEPQRHSPQGWPHSSLRTEMWAAWSLWVKVLCCAKSLQSCLTLCDPMDCSPPGCSVHGILQARMLKWVAMTSSNSRVHFAVKMGSSIFSQHHADRTLGSSKWNRTDGTSAVSHWLFLQMLTGSGWFCVKVTWQWQGKKSNKREEDTWRVYSHLVCAHTYSRRVWPNLSFA